MTTAAEPVGDTESVIGSPGVAAVSRTVRAAASCTEHRPAWLDRIADVIATSAGVTAHDLDTAPFTDRGGFDGALRDLGAEAASYLEQLKSELTA